MEALGEGVAARPEERVDDARKTHVDGQEVVEKHALHLLLVLAKEEDLLNGKAALLCMTAGPLRVHFICRDQPRAFFAVRSMMASVTSRLFSQDFIGRNSRCCGSCGRR